jgi:hypothetical protein
MKLRVRRLISSFCTILPHVLYGYDAWSRISKDEENYMHSKTKF